MKERRKFPRYDVALDVEYDATNDFEIHSKTSTINVSEVGMSIPLNKAIHPGKKLDLKLRLPYKDKEIDVKGKVVWRKALDKNEGPEENAGIEFLEMDKTNRMVLVDCIKNYPV